MDLEREHPDLKQSMLKSLANVQPGTARPPAEPSGTQPQRVRGAKHVDRRPWLTPSVLIPLADASPR